MQPSLRRLKNNTTPFDPQQAMADAPHEFGEHGGLFTLDMGSEKKAFALLNHLQNEGQFGYMAVSLGYFDTLMSCSAASTSSELSKEALQEAGISPGLVRFPIGLTSGIE